MEEKKLLDKFNAAHYSTGRVAAGFTSAAMEPETVHIAERIEDDLVRYSYVMKKGDNAMFIVCCLAWFFFTVSLFVW